MCQIYSNKARTELGNDQLRLDHLSTIIHIKFTSDLHFPENFYPVYENAIFLRIDMLSEANHFPIVLDKEVLQCINMWFSFGEIYFTEGNSSD